MTNMSDSQFEFEDKYDDDFYDDPSGDEYANGNGSDRDEPKKNGYDSQSSDDEGYKRNSPPMTPRKDATPRKNDKKEERNVKISYNPMTRRTQSDPRGKKTKTQRNTKPTNNRGPPKPKATDGNESSGTVVKRVISASRNKVKRLHNIIHELQLQVESLTVENRDLKRAAFLQNRELRKLDQSEADLPALIKKHSAELNVVQEKYRRHKETSQVLAESLKKSDNELRKAKDKLKECQTLIKEKNLGERVELKNKIAELENLCEEKTNKINELNRCITLQKKSHSRSVKEKNEKIEKAMEKVKILEEVQADLVSKIKDRERALQVTNIYARRIPKDGKLSSSRNQPVSPILKKYIEEEVDIVLSPRAKTPEKDEKQEVFANSSLEDRVVTMVNLADNVTDTDDSKDVLTPRTDKRAATSFVGKKLNREENEDFYGIGETKNENERAAAGSQRGFGSAESVKRNEREDEDDHKVHEELEVRSDNVEETGVKGGDMSVAEEINNDFAELEVAGRKVNEEEESRKRVDADKEAAKKLLLAKMMAIDSGVNPDEVTKPPEGPSKIPKKMNAKKKPIFLMDSQKASADSGDEENSPYSGESFHFDSKPRAAPLNHSGVEADGSGKRRGERKNSWEFKSTDENLHRGFPSHSDPSSRQASGVRLREDSLDSLRQSDSARSDSGRRRNSSGPPKRDGTQNHSGGRPKKDSSGRGRFDYHYSPTPLENNVINNAVQAKSKGKKSGAFDLFEQFEDPFKDSNAKDSNARTKSDNSSSISSDIQEDTSIKNHDNRKSHQTANEVDDDLEEMFIL